MGGISSLIFHLTTGFQEVEEKGADLKLSPLLYVSL
jgi:hypothetical protein